MKKTCIFLSVISIFLAAIMTFAPVNGLASGLLDDFDDLFGQPMPSPRYTLNRKADDQTNDSSGLTLCWQKTDEQDYLAFSRYLEANGFALLFWEVSNDTVISDVAGIRGTFKVRYSRAGQTLSVCYP